jgi:hypothetical protein
MLKVKRGYGNGVWSGWAWGALVVLAALAVGNGLAPSGVGQTVKVLAINTRTPPMQVAKSPLLISFSGSLASSEQLYVRVFRESLDYLVNTVPAAAKAKDCAIYTATQVYPVRVEGGVLRVDRLVEFFALREGARQQTFTLVFESGQNNVSNGQLRLAKGEDGVRRYFAHAIQWTLNAPDEMVGIWTEQARMRQVASKPVSPGASSLGLFSFLTGRKVQAAPIANVPITPAPAATPAAPAQNEHGKCQTVVERPVTNTALNPEGNGDRLEASVVFAEREAAACGDAKSMSPFDGGRDALAMPAGR